MPLPPKCRSAVLANATEPAVGDASGPHAVMNSRIAPSAAMAANPP
jgi:hypothetical protein